MSSNQCLRGFGTLGQLVEAFKDTTEEKKLTPLQIAILHAFCNEKLGYRATNKVTNVEISEALGFPPTEAFDASGYHVCAKHFCELGEALEGLVNRGVNRGVDRGYVERWFDEARASEYYRISVEGQLAFAAIPEGTVAAALDEVRRTTLAVMQAAAGRAPAR